MSHEHENSILVRCLSCHMWGINFPGELGCGNCKSSETVLYRPPCCFDALRARLAAAEAELGTMRMEHAVWEKRGLCQIVKERDEALAALNCILEAHRAVFERSVAARAFDGDGRFAQAWMRAEAALDARAKENSGKC
jgi:hypothetical protein